MVRFRSDDSDVLQVLEQLRSPVRASWNMASSHSRQSLEYLCRQEEVVVPETDEVVVEPAVSGLLLSRRFVISSSWSVVRPLERVLPNISAVFRFSSWRTIKSLLRPKHLVAEVAIIWFFCSFSSLASRCSRFTVLLMRTERRSELSGSSMLFNLFMDSFSTLRRSSFWRYLGLIMVGLEVGRLYVVRLPYSSCMSSSSSSLQPRSNESSMRIGSLIPLSDAQSTSTPNSSSAFIVVWASPLEGG